MLDFYTLYFAFLITFETLFWVDICCCCSRLDILYLTLVRVLCEECINEWTSEHFNEWQTLLDYAKSQSRMRAGPNSCEIGVIATATTTAAEKGTTTRVQLHFWALRPGVCVRCRTPSAAAGVKMWVIDFYDGGSLFRLVRQVQCRRLDFWVWLWF